MSSQTVSLEVQCKNLACQHHWTETPDQDGRTTVRACPECNHPACTILRVVAGPRFEIYASPKSDWFKGTPEAELAAIDDLLFDASADFAASEVKHQVDCHADTLGMFVHRLAEHLRKIHNVGKERREKQTEHL